MLAHYQLNYGWLVTEVYLKDKLHIKFIVIKSISFPCKGVLKIGTEIHVYKYLSQYFISMLCKAIMQETFNPKSIRLTQFF